jgi:nucleotide-binding universal stress UspA family protein
MRILLVVDDSASSVDVIETVAARAWPENAMVRVLSVPKCVPVELHPNHDSLELAQQEMTRMAERLTSRVTDVLRAKPLPADMAIRFGDPAAEILNEAQEWSANLIVVGANSFESDDPEESVAQSVISQASCRVEIVEQGDAAYNARSS